jgi:hypothetical protein
VVESSALLKRRTSKGYRGFESLPHRFFPMICRILGYHCALCLRETGDSNLGSAALAFKATKREGEIYYRVTLLHTSAGRVIPPSPVGL